MFIVAPFVGVWIEMESISWDCIYISVAPFVGVWIEIKNIDPEEAVEAVAPFVGVWIEIYLKIQIDYNLKSLPLWECGLK